MSDNKRTMTEVSVYSFTSRELEILRTMKGLVSSDNPLRVHRYGDGFIVSLGMFHNGENDASERLAPLGFSKPSIEMLAEAAATGATYIDISADASAEVTIKPYLDLSTGHLRVKDGDLLEGIGSGKIVGKVPFIVHSTEHGYVVDIRSVAPAQDIRDFGFSTEFSNLIAYAASKNAPIIDFDNDADYEPGFSIFDQVTDEDITVDHAEYGRRS
ncbi:hypothetical protein G6L37_34545 [Agrobacterium rubi]|nr:hypothetical protein [Agrobacterium rubi]NTF23687.1 hypothetical protein [Agrobacterium rubi]